MRKVIINLCPTGMVPTKRMNSFVPVTPQEIIESVITCAEWGVSVAHIHPRGSDGKPTWDKGTFEKIIGGIRERAPDLVISATTSGRNWGEFEKRSEVLELQGDLKPDLASLTVGSMNFIRTSSTNSPQMIKDLATKMQDNGIKPELEVFEPGMIHKANYLIKKGIVPSNKPYFNMLFGSLGTSPLLPSTFAACHALLPSDAVWSMAGIGSYQLDANLVGLAFGGHIRVGLEDNIYFDRGREEPASNTELVARIVGIICEMGLEPATPEEARDMLGLG